MVIRKHYIDNLRNITILLLFVVHTFMVWNDFGSKFYVWQGENKLLSVLIVLINPWFMPILFVIAGISARFSLQKRSVREFILQRVCKLLVPFILGVVFLVPIQTFFARKFFYAYDGGLIENWRYFFTHVTDLTGYDGAFTPEHLWFILFLFVISVFSLILFHFLPYEKIKGKIEKLPLPGILALFIFVWLMYYLGNFGGFSLGKNFALYLFGYYVLSNDLVLQRIEKSFKPLACLLCVCVVISAALYYKFSYYGDLWVNFIGWLSILVFLVFGKKFLDKQTCFTRYFNRASYPVYILHQSVLVAIAYYVVNFCNVFFVQVIFICFGSFAATMLIYQLGRCIRKNVRCDRDRRGAGGLRCR